MATTLTSTTKTRTLRLTPRNVMTGDLLVQSDVRGQQHEDCITWLEQTPDKRYWRIETVRNMGGTYSNQRRITIKRSGPPGLGE